MNTCTNQVEDTGPQTPFATNTQYSNNWCLPEAQYRFTINDSFGDGICCGYGLGAYSVTWDGSVLVNGGGQFASSETTTFGSCSQAPPTPPPTPSPTTANVSYSSFKCHMRISSSSHIETFALIIFSNFTCTANPSSLKSTNTSSYKRSHK